MDAKVLFVSPRAEQQASDTEKEVPIRIVLPFKDQTTANPVRRQPSDLRPKIRYPSHLQQPQYQGRDQVKKKKLPTQNQKMSCNSNVTRVLFLKCCLPKLKPKLNEQNDSIRTKSVSLLIDYFLITICIVLVPFKIFKNSCHLFLYILSLLSFVQFPLFNNRINVVYFFLNLQMSFGLNTHSGANFVGMLLKIFSYEHN